MPTEKPKVSAYVSEVVYQALVDYQLRNGLSSVSSAAGEVLSKFLLQGGSPVNQNAIDSMEERLRKLEEEVRHLSQLALVSPKAYPLNKPKVINPGTSHINSGLEERSEPPVVHSNHPQGALSQNKICELFGIPAKSVSRKAKTRRIPTHQYVESVTGWIFKDGLYYPPEQPIN